LDGFWGCAVNQANSFEGRGSGWIFRSISQFDVPYAEARNTGAVRYGAAPRDIYGSYWSMVPNGLKAKLKWNFQRGLIVDPDLLFPSAGTYLCVLKSISLQMAMSSKGTLLSKIKKYGRDMLWRLLRTALKPTIDWVPMAMESRITASSFESLEEENLFSSRKQEDAGNYRLLKRLYPGIVEEYKGIAVNLYAPLREEAASSGEEICLYPLVCSKNCNDPSYLQVDLLKDAVELYAAQHRYARKGKKNAI
jgi:hypothetical protein